jgi:hypothetical protein
MPGFKEIFAVLILKLAPLLLIYVLACKWILNALAVPSPYAFWINFLGVLLIARVVAGSLFIRMYRADRAERE